MEEEVFDYTQQHYTKQKLSFCILKEEECAWIPRKENFFFLCISVFVLLSIFRQWTINGVFLVKNEHDFKNNDEYLLPFNWPDSVTKY